MKRRFNRLTRRPVYRAVRTAYLAPLELATVGHADDRYFPRIPSALVVTDSRTGNTITISAEEEATIFRALEHYRDDYNSLRAAHLAARIDAL